MLIRARAPLRLGLAGGGTDVSPYCDQFGGRVLNVTIDRYAYALLKSAEKNVKFTAADKNLSRVFPSGEELHLDGDLKLHIAVYNCIMKEYNSSNYVPLELVTYCEAPIGSGLGSSSTIVVAIIKAFVEYLNLPLDDYEIASLAYRIEREDCSLSGGRQDQYSATFGGFNFMEFYDNNRAVINPLRVKNWIVCELEASLLLYYTGVSRESAKIIVDQKLNMGKKNSSSLDSFHDIKNSAILMKESLLRGDFDGIVQSLEKGWESKKKSSEVVSNPYIESIYTAALQAGARAGKVSGAGGGGFMMFFVDPEKRLDVIRALDSFDGKVVSNVNFTKFGCQAWRIL